MRFLTAILLTILFSGYGNSASGQPSNTVVPSDKADKIAYRILFQQTLLYKKLADEADAAHQPKPHLRHVLENRYALSADDNASLERMAIAYQVALKPLLEQRLAIVKKYRARFPFGVVAPGADITPPPELAELQQQEDAVTILYRDLLHNSMREENFKKMNSGVTTDFGQPLKNPRP
jgi:hypothetical protein